MKKNNIDYNKKIIQVKNLRQYFKSGFAGSKIIVRAVDGVSFDIYKREVFGLVGESGCGKTTTGRTMIKLYNPTDGKVIFNDNVIAAGYLTNINNIKKAKAKMKKEVIDLSPEKKIFYQAKQEFLNEKRLHKNNLIILKENYLKEKEIHLKVVNDYQQNLKTIKEDYLVEKGELKRLFYSQKQAIEIRGIVPIVRRHNLERKLAIQKAKGKVKYILSTVMDQIDKDDQIRDIELTKQSELEAIEERTLVRLKARIENFDEYVDGLGDVHYRKIVRDFINEEKLVKKEQTIKLKTKYKDSLEETKTNYLTRLEEAKEKDFNELEIKEKVAQIKNEYQEKVRTEKERFKTVKDIYKEKKVSLKADIKKDALEKPNWDEIAKVKSQYRAYKTEQKEKIKIAKRENKLKESSEAKAIRLKKLALEKADFQKSRAELKSKIAEAMSENEIKAIKNEMKELKQTYQENIAAIQKTKPSHANRVLSMQMIFQDPISSLNPRMVVSEIISEGLKISGLRDKRIMKEKVYEILNLVGLNKEHATRYPHEFSGGQRQRIGVARALITNPDFIIADEPISALDVSIQAQVINLLNDLKEELDLTIMFIAHDLSVVKYFCDRIAVMYYGKIVEMASSDELFLNPLHPYTKSLLSAIPQPDPHSEKERKRLLYNPFMHDYRVDKPTLKEIKEGHFILANDKELAEYKKELK